VAEYGSPAREFLLQILVNILVLAAIYALISCGFVLVYRVSRVLNLAHGELMTLGAYGLYSTASLFNGSPLVALIAAAGLAVLVGVLVYLALMRRMAGENVLAAVLTSIALGILLQGLMLLVWSGQQQYPLRSLGWENTSLPVGDARISAVALTLVLITATVYLGLFLFLRHTRWGIRMRAAGQNPLLAAQRGIRLHGVYALAWGLSTFTGGLAGMLLACDSGLDQSMMVIGLKAFPAALVGGLDSLLGAVLGSLVIATAEVVLIHYVDPLLADVVPFLVLTAMLIVRPWGLFGTREELDRV
jgi:branched-chain amino acid transport system permease protein